MTQNQSKLSDPQNRFKNIIRNSLDLVLKEAGYKKKGTKYQLQGSYFLYEIKTRKSKHSSKSSILFTVDFDIWLPKQVSTSLPFPFMAPILGGDVIGMNTKRWFDLEDDELNWQTKDEEFIEKIKEIISLHLLPFFSKINYLQDIIPLLKQNEGEYKLRLLNFISTPFPSGQTKEWLAIIYYILKDKEKSIEIIDQSIASSNKFPAFVEKIKKLKQQILDN